jgi:hypothetical protein
LPAYRIRHEAAKRLKSFPEKGTPEQREELERTAEDGLRREST